MAVQVMWLCKEIPRGKRVVRSMQIATALVAGALLRRQSTVIFQGNEQL